MAYKYQNSYYEQESAEYNSRGHMGNNGCHNNQLGFGSGMGHHQMAGYSDNQLGFGNGMGHHQIAGYSNNQLGFGNGMGHHQMDGYSNYGCPDSSYGMSNHNGHGYNNHNHHGGLGMASSYAMNEESSFYSAQNSCYPHKSYY